MILFLCTYFVFCLVDCTQGVAKDGIGCKLILILLVGLVGQASCKNSDVQTIVLVFDCLNLAKEFG